MKPPVTVVGGGIAGLSAAWELAKRGRAVRVLEAHRIGGGTSAVATGYLEPRLGRTAARRLEWTSLRMWPAFATELERKTGHDVGLRTSGQWRYAFREDEPEVRADFEARRAAGWRVDWVEGDEVRAQDPLVSSDVIAAARVHDPAWVDGPALCRALAQAIAACPSCEVVENRPARPTDCTGTTLIAAGDGTAALELDLPPIRRTKGTTLFYEGEYALTRMLRHKTLSIVPRVDGLVVGSSRERGATSLEPDPAVVDELHAKAVRVLPILAHRTPVARCGFRAMIGDGSLNLGRRGDLFWSLSHAGVGYLRAPLVAREMAAAIDGEAPKLTAPFFRTI